MHDIVPFDVHVCRNVTGGLLTEDTVEVLRLDLTRTGPFAPNVIHRENLASLDRGHGDDARVGEVDGDLFLWEDTFFPYPWMPPTQLWTRN